MREFIPDNHNKAKVAVARPCVRGAHLHTLLSALRRWNVRLVSHRAVQTHSYTASRWLAVPHQRQSKRQRTDHVVGSDLDEDDEDDGTTDDEDEDNDDGETDDGTVDDRDQDDESCDEEDQNEEYGLGAEDESEDSDKDSSDNYVPSESESAGD